MFHKFFPDTDFMINKELRETEGDLDIKELWDNWEGTAQELADMLDISVSTANNWISAKGDISEMAKQALGYQRLKTLISNFLKQSEEAIICQKDNYYEIYQKTGSFYEIIATTKYLEIARLIQKKALLIKLLKWALNFIQTELETRESVNAKDLSESYYKDFYNLLDCLYYIKFGKTFSETQINEIENINLKELFKSKDNAKQIPSLKESILQVGTLFKYEAKKTTLPYKKYKGCILTVLYEKKNSYKVLPVQKDGEIWSDYTDLHGMNAVGKTFPTLNAAMSAIYYTKTKSMNVWRDCEYSTDNGKTWHPAEELYNK